MKQEFIGSIALSSGREVRISKISRDNGKRYVDVRIFYTDVDKGLIDAKDVMSFANGEKELQWFPTKKGIQLDVNDFKELMDEILIPLFKGLENKKKGESL